MHFAILIALVLASFPLWPGKSFAAYCANAPSCSTSIKQGDKCNANHYNSSWQHQGWVTVVVLDTPYVGDVCTTTRPTPFIQNSLLRTGTMACDGQSDKYAAANVVTSGACPGDPCTSWTYTPWGECSNGTQTRTVLTASPLNCVGGNPIVSQSCEPTEPETCNNGSKDSNEEGIDCGGACTAACEEYCPDGTHTECDYTGDCDCVYTTAQDQFGNCPHNFVPTTRNNGEKICVSFPADSTPIKAKNQALADGSVNYSSPPGWSNGSETSTTTNGGTNTTINGDGTTTTTNTTTTIYGSGSGTTTNTTIQTVITNTATGEVISDTTTTDTETGPEDNPENYSFTVTDTPSTGEIPTGIAPAITPFSDFLNNAVTSNPATDIIEDTGLETFSPDCSYTGILMGETFTVSFCSDAITDALESMGSILVSICYLLAIFIIFA